MKKRLRDLEVMWLHLHNAEMKNEMQITPGIKEKAHKYIRKSMDFKVK